MKIKKRFWMIFHNFCRKASLLVRVFLNKIIVFLRKYHRILTTSLRIIYNFNILKKLVKTRFLAQLVNISLMVIWKIFYQSKHLIF